MTRVFPAGLLVVLSGLLPSCGSGGNVGSASDQLALPPGIPASQLPDPESDGARLVARYCSSCHGIPSPRSHSAQDWVSTTRRMFLRMDHMGRMGGGMMGRRGMMGGMRVPVPSRSEEPRILSYLQDHALSTTEPDALPRAGSDAATLFSRSCSRCHALPDPAQHTPDEWAAVVERMKGHMQEMQVGGLTDQETRTIVAYLRQASAGAGDGP